MNEYIGASSSLLSCIFLILLIGLIYQSHMTGLPILTLIRITSNKIN